MCTPQCIIEQLGCRAFDEAVNAASKAGKYVLQYRTNLDKLRTEMGKLEDRRVIIERKVREANDRGEEIENAVSHWQTDVDEMKNYVQDLIERSTAEAKMHCFSCSCPNIKGRYRLSKQAEEKIADVKKLAQESHFDEISHPKPPPPELVFPSAQDYVHLDSRTPIIDDIVGALKDPNVKMIGVYGLGGVGKTTLVEKVAKKMLDDGTFKHVPLVAVSKDLNVKDIQKKLANKLNLELKATADENAVAIQLWNKFKNGEKYLVILDDIWEKVDLKAIGIPVMEGNIGCKVVLTSRKENLLRTTMKANRNFPIAELPEGEAWDLFKKNVGNTIESQPEIDSLARQVCRKCKGLPVAINALGAALEDKPYHTWKNALDKLEKHMLTHIEGIDPSVWASLWVSFDMLRSSDAQSCFLLCCLFAEDAEIPIDELMRHCMARSLLAQNPRTFDEARTAMCTVVDVLKSASLLTTGLKSASLLTTGGHETVVKIHDVIRDVGISIAREKEAFLVDHGALRWPRNPTNGPSYKAMSLSLKNIKEHPDGLVYPQLETLMVDSSISDLEFPDNFFTGLMQLTVLTFTRMYMRRLPSSLAKLGKLRMLCLNECKLDDIAILKDLKSTLEVLSLRGSNIEALPPEIRQLTGLRVLDLQDCDKLMMIPRGVISNLTSLEELYFPENFDKWEATTDEQQHTSSRENVSLEELKGLLSSTGQLSTLHIYIPDVMLLPKDDLIFANLKGFKISVGSKFYYLEKLISGRCMLKLKGIQLRNEFIPLVDKAEVVVLSEIEGLKKLFVQSQGLHRLPSFNNLIVLIIEDCKLKYLFSPTTAKELVHLEKLEVKFCEIMEGIVGFEGRNDEDEITSEVKFSKLKQLELEDLPNLLSFYAQKEKMGTTMGSSSACAQPLFSEKVIFPVLKKLSIRKMHKIIEIWDKQSIAVLEEQEFFYQLTDLDVSNCEKLMHVFPSKMHSLLKNLKVLRVSDCLTMEGIVEFEGEMDEDGLSNEVCFSELSSLELSSLPNLECFCTKLGKVGTTEGNSTIHALPLFNGKVVFPVLKHTWFWNLDKITRIWDDQPLSELEKEAKSFSGLDYIFVHDCDQLEYVLPSYMLPQLKNLRGLHIERCRKMEVIVSNNPKEKEAIRFPKLEILVLGLLPNLKSFICSDETQSIFSNKVAFPVLEILNLYIVHKITRIWDNQPLSETEKEAKSFSQLRNIMVDSCNQLEYVLPFYMFPQLKNLQKLKIEGCRKVEAIISNNPKEKEATNNNDTIRFPQLKEVSFGDLPKLKSFICSETQLLFSNKVAFPVLEKLNLYKVHKITRIWDNQPLSETEKEAKSFSQLRNIIVDSCNQLEYVLPFYMFPQLKNLQELKIWGCRKVEAIISNNPKEKEATNNNDTIRFPQLKEVSFRDLPKLKSFICSETQHLFSNKVAFPILETLKFRNLSKITRIWDEQPLSKPEKESKSFYKLMVIKVADCDQLEYVLPSCMLPQLKNLQQLRIKECRKMEVIITKSPKAKEATNNDPIRFPQLKEVKLWDLPNLKSFICSEMQLFFSNKVAFPVLETLKFKDLHKITRIWDNQPLSQLEKEAKSFCKLMVIEVEDCDQLEYVLPLYMLPQLKNLQNLTIIGCTKMEVIISNHLKEKEATNNDPIRFPQLKEVKLWVLPNLKSFICSETQLFFSNKDAFPVLESISLDEDSEILQDGTYTKEVSMEFLSYPVSLDKECSTSGKESDPNGEELDEDLEVSTEEWSTSNEESDHNGEELDEDLKTPTKKVSVEECGTSGPSGKENEHNGEQG